MAISKVVTVNVSCDRCGENLNQAPVTMAEAEQVANAATLTLTVKDQTKVQRSQAVLCETCSEAAQTALSYLGLTFTERERGAVASGSTAPKGDGAAIRDWARANGHNVGTRGRIAPEVKAAYAKAQAAKQETTGE